MFKGFMKDSFSEQYKNPKWQKKRLKILERDNYQCQHCDESELTLQVHHLSYPKGINIWECKDENLITLCEPCHRRVTDLIDLVRVKSEEQMFVEFMSTCAAVHSSVQLDVSDYLGMVLSLLVNRKDMIFPIYQMLMAQRSEDKK